MGIKDIFKRFFDSISKYTNGGTTFDLEELKTIGSSMFDNYRD